MSAPAVSGDERAMALWALLFAAGRPVARSRLAQVMGATDSEVDAAASALSETLAATSAPLAVERLVSGYQLVLAPAYHPLARSLVGEAQARLSPAVLESLAVIAYGQPASRAAIEAARGVRAERSIAILLERGLVREAAPPSGASREDGPYYVTTRAFLDAFGLVSLADLPPWPGEPPLPRQASLPLEGAGGHATPNGPDHPELAANADSRNQLP